MPPLSWLFTLGLGFSTYLSVHAQDGGVTGPTTSIEAAGYSCDPSLCKLPDCNCASTSPPGGLAPADTPQFIVFTADDAIQSYTLDVVNGFLAHRRNPNGCSPKMTYYTSLGYTNYTLVTDWYVAGNEIADHTMTHQADPSPAEIDGNLVTLNSLAGIPFSSIQGFRAPYLNYSTSTLRHLYAAGFLYDSSATSAIPVTDPRTDAFWPYTLDHGMANDCMSVDGLCKGQLRLKGFWEIPMYAFFDQLGQPHLMDPWLDLTNGATTPNDTATAEYMRKTFTDHYNGNRQPIGLYTHPVHLSTLPGLNVRNTTIPMINAFLDWAQGHDNVWIVSTAQLLAWVRNPVPASALRSGSFKPFQCPTPNVDPSLKICNGIPANEDGLLSHCSIGDGTFFTCYGCPVEQPTPQNPNPVQAPSSGSKLRLRVPANCSTPFWDPILGKCLCTSSECAFEDVARPIGIDGVNITGGGTGGWDNTSAAGTSKYVPFNGNGAASLHL
ncbi:chitin deacetylase 9, partial [Moniliophthora roreri]